jgi:DNA primase
MISPKTIAAIRDRVEIVAVIAESVKLTRKGRSFVGLCPFHQEKTPSFNVNAEKGFFYCFGCKEKGNVFDFVMKVEGLSFPEAARRLAERGGIEIEETATDAERREAEAARRAIDDLYSVNQLAAHWFERQLREHPLARIARDELRRRGLASSTGDLDAGVDVKVKDALQAFRIGYAPPAWDGLTHFLAQQGISPVTASKVGLIAPRKTGSGHYDWFRHRLLFAIVDVQGRVVGFSGRILPDPETGVVDKQSPKYINSPESPIYQKGHSLFGLYQARQAIRKKEEAILVEGNFDVVSLHARGIDNVVAPLGTAFTPPQAKLLRRFAPLVTLLFDGDAAGKKATREARETCRSGGLVAKVAVLPGAKDPDDFVRERGAEALLAAVRAARGILEHLIEEALDETIVRPDADERAARVRQVVQLINSETDPTARALASMMAKKYADQIAQRTGVPGSEALPQLQRTIERAFDSAGGMQAAPSNPSGGGPKGAPNNTWGRGSETSPLQTVAPTSSPPPTDISPWRARSRDQKKEIALSILGCFLDFPDLIHDPSSEQAIQQLEGDVALAVATLSSRTAGGPEGAPSNTTDAAASPPTTASFASSSSQEAGQKISGDVLEILAHVPASIHTFAAQRLASPVHQHREDARLELVKNTQKLKEHGFTRHETQVVEALHRMDRTGDATAGDTLLRDLVRRAREKRGLQEG